MSTQLVVTLSGLGNQALDTCAEFAAELDRRRIPLSLLVAPRPGSAESPSPDSAALQWIHHRRAQGDAIVLHGFDHAAGSEKRLLPRLASAGRPAGALRGAEFAALPAHEASLRLVAALAAMDRLGLRAGSFVPPRWVASPGTVTALRRHGFTVCADALAIRELATGRVHRARVHGLGPGERAEPWWCRALVLGVARAARRGRMVRLAVDVSDLQRPGPRQAVLDAIDLAMHHDAQPITHDAFVGRIRIPRPRTGQSEMDAPAPNLDPLSS